PMKPSLPGETPRRDNGLSAASYVPLADVDPDVGDHLLSALRRARIAAYLEPAAEADRQRLYVATGDRADARTIVQVAARADGESAMRPPDLLDGVDTNAEFSALIADWHVDTINAVRAAERDLTREDAEWRARIEPRFTDASAEDDEEHYVPPPPPPLPRLSGATIGALLIMSASIVVLILGSEFGLPSDFSFLAGVAGVLVGAGILLMRLRERPPDDEDDDGAVV
ncbi:MAG TPA: hypothetical protein VEK09_02935, partial [Jatrophihabitantaceae bacterium]|nr:hypothetical protein [Jatrophihabitantaceae bacterium]